MRNQQDEELFFDAEGNVDIEAMCEARCEARGEPLPNNPPPGPKWQAKQGLHRLSLNGSEAAVLWCLIDHASSKTGRCYPSQPRMAEILSIPEATVRRAVRTLRGKHLITIITRRNTRGERFNSYLINWPPLFSAYAQMESASRHRSKMDGGFTDVTCNETCNECNETCNGPLHHRSKMHTATVQK
jgi:hypothetical protein